ncbi:MAG TPA: aldo/keto reductase [Flavisolibacter sp.]|jgi:aryl-alcohol dehydrogenase-like predicted oxidoreductase|nr:aldo/keto reductase [Flavisolibacter sp.]
MEYQQLGKADLKISRIGFGCMSLKSNDPESEKVLQQAMESGINYFDTADLYDKGANEEMLGRVFKQNRDKIILATKAGNQWRPDGSGWDWNPRKEYILQCAEQSLKRLQTDYIDLFQLHGGTMNDPLDETMEAFEQLVKEGKIRYYGISSIRPNVIKYWSAHSNIVSVMTQYSLLDRRPEEETLDLLKQKNIGVVVRGSVGQGLLVDKPSRPHLDYSEEEVHKRAKAIKELSYKNRTAAQTAIQYVLNHPAVTSAIVGMRTMEQLEEAVHTLNAFPLKEEELMHLKKALSANYYKEHR